MSANAALPTRKIGTDDVSAIGFGAMGLSGAYSAIKPDEERFAVLDELHAQGCTFWDTAHRYGDSEALLGKWFKRTGKRADIFLATKFGVSLDAARQVDGRPAFMREQIKESLERLGVDTIDLYYLHRPDSATPIEVTVGAMAELVKAGTVRYLGLSEVSGATLRRAHAVHPIAAVQVEYSPFTLDIEVPAVGLLAAARELGVAVVAYSPLGRGLLTGRYKGPEDLADGAAHKIFPRFSAEHFPKTLAVVDGLNAIAARHDATAGQVALAWVLAQGEDIVPIPGTTKVENLKQNLGALNMRLSAEEVATIRDLVDKAGVAKVDRYPAAMQKMLYVETPALNTWKAE